jgi:hypothetical protein
VPCETRVKTEPPALSVPVVCPPSPVGPLLPRLLDVAATAAYTGLSTWTVRHSDALAEARVLVPGVRRALYDRQALDQLVSRWGGHP